MKVRELLKSLQSRTKIHIITTPYTDDEFICENPEQAIINYGHRLNDIKRFHKVIKFAGIAVILSNLNALALYIGYPFWIAFIVSKNLCVINVCFV